MKILTSLFGGGTAAALRTSVQAAITASELPYSEIAKLLWSYFLNNGLYDELQLAGYFLGDETLKSLRNPAGRVVKFYTDTIWPGRLPDALPLDTMGNENLVAPISDLWKWSNWQSNKQILALWTAVLGEAYIKIAQPEGKERVYLQNIRPEYVPDGQVDFDAQGNVTYIRVDVPQTRRENDRIVYYTHTEVWDKAAGVARFWLHKQGAETAVARLGTPTSEYDMMADWGIDFVPFVRAVHTDVGEDRGVGAFLLQLDKINEANRVATDLHAQIFRHNKPKWALRANGVDQATGRALPPPNVATTKNAAGEDVVEMSGEKFIRLPGTSTLEPLVPPLNYADHLAILQDHMAELENDLPELRYFRLQDAPDLSGRAIRLLMAPALASAVEVRGNLEDALVRAQKMALTIGQNAGVWKGLGNYEAGDLEHNFHERAVLNGGRYEDAEIWQAETAAGLPLLTVLKRSGWTEEQLDELERDYARLQAMQQAGMAASLLGALDRFDAGQAGQETAVPQAEAATDTPENIESDKGLNGAQINAALDLLNGVTQKTLAPSVAVELLVSLGIQRERAQRMVQEAQVTPVATPTNGAENAQNGQAAA